MIRFKFRASTAVVIAHLRRPSIAGHVNIQAQITNNGASFGKRSDGLIPCVQIHLLIPIAALRQRPELLSQETPIMTLNGMDFSFLQAITCYYLATHCHWSPFCHKCTKYWLMAVRCASPAPLRVVQLQSAILEQRMQAEHVTCCAAACARASDAAGHHVGVIDCSKYTQ